MKNFLKKHIPLPERVREKKMKSFDELLKEVPEIELIIDVTEQERQKPKDKSERKEILFRKEEKAHDKESGSDREMERIDNRNFKWA